MALVQVRLIPLYRRIPFGPPWWAFSFPYAAVVGYAIQWITAEHMGGTTALTWSLLIITTTAFSALLIRTGRALATRQFLPAAVEPQLSPDSSTNQQPARALG